MHRYISSLILLLLSRNVLSWAVPSSSRVRRTPEYPSIKQNGKCILASNFITTDFSIPSLKEPKYTSSTPVVDLQRRSSSEAPAVSFSVQNLQLTLYCNLPNSMPQNPEFQTARQTICNLVQQGLVNAARRLQRIVYFQHPVKVTMHFGSTCLGIGGTDDVIAKCEWDKGLGAAAPSGMHELSQSVASKLGLDSEYLYPNAVLRQYLPNDPMWDTSTDDIFASFNSDAPWWFPSDDNRDGEGSGNGGSFGPPLTRTRTREFGKGVFSSPKPDLSVFDDGLLPSDKIYDFEQTVLHEIMHGLGFVSSWWQSLQPGTFFPGGPVTYQTNGIQGVTFGKSNIFDRTMAHSGTGVMMRDYAAAMREEAKLVSQDIVRASPNLTASDLLTQWTNQFKTSNAFLLSQNLYSSAAVIPMQLILWFQDRRGNPRYAILYTPRAFAGGSSVSHLDASVYGSSSEFLMRPFCTTGTGIDGFTPAHPKIGVLGEAVPGILRQMGYITAITEE
ncbi:hypothetical protein HDU79_008106 [Rhizoclosmatium sp. JEL0117]|nr:hypothetical protein HDU79_008106 [Rhizoclosmatium sp. JEL0117]